MQCPLGEISEEMAVRKETKAEIAQEVATQLSAAVEDLKPKGLRKILYGIREWGAVGAVVTIFLSPIAIAVALGIFAFSHIEQNARFQKGMEDFQTDAKNHLDRTDRTLNSLQGLLASQFPEKTFRSLTDLDPKSFGVTLPALRKVSEQPPSEVKATPPMLREVAEKLRDTDQHTPEYWPTVFQFINFASASGSPPDVPPPGEPNAAISKSRVSINMEKKIVLFDGSDIFNSVFKNCRITFTENPTRFENVTFVDCVFEIPVKDVPNQYLRRVSEDLLASDFNSIKIPNL